MINKKEFFSIITISLILGIIISLIQSLNLFLTTTLFVFLIIMINILAKKAASYYFDTEIEIKIWELKQFGYKKHHHFKSYIQAGIFVPLILKFASVQIVNWMACLTFEASGKVYRAARRHGIYSYSEVSEEEIGWIAGAGIIANILLALVGYLAGQEELATLSISYAFYNLIPIFDLDGAKIFFGNITFWAFLTVISVLGFVAAIVMV